MDTLILGLRVVVSLGAVFGLMWFLNKRLRSSGTAVRARLLSVVARQNVGPKASVVLVDTDGRRFLLGVTEQGISVLHTSTAPEAAGEPTPPTPVPPMGAAARPAAERLLTPVRPWRSGPGAETTASKPEFVPFDAELARLRERVTENAGEGVVPDAAPADEVPSARTGSILEPATWRLAAESLRSGRRQ